MFGRRIVIILLLIPAMWANAADRVCAPMQTACSDGPRSVVIDGMPITRPCWRRTTTFACIEPDTVDSCAAPRQRGCTPGRTWCADTVTMAGATLCVTEEREFACTTDGGQASTVSDCAGQQYCLDGHCFDAGSATDGDFQRAVAMMETAREAGVYLDQDKLQVFRGEDRRCAKTVLRNCCRGASHNGSDLNNRAVQDGSQHAYDVLSGPGMPSALRAGIDPAGYLASTVREVGREMAGCSRDEALTAVRRAKGLCYHVGDYCSRHIRLGFASVCVERKETHCCYNSRIARLVAEAARNQLAGLGWGDPETPRCQGLTVAQFQALDLSRIDFSEVYEDIVPRAGSHTGAASMRTPVGSYFDR